MLYNLLKVGKAWYFILDKLLHKQQFKDGVQREDGVRFYTSIVGQEKIIIYLEELWVTQPNQD
jgi:hypothetical protein